jgi:hypothetical protein
MSFSTTYLALYFFLVVVGKAGGGTLDQGRPSADGGGHDIDDAAVLLLQGGIKDTPPSPNPLVSGENPKLRLGRWQRTSVIPYMEALPWRYGVGGRVSEVVRR